MTFFEEQNRTKFVLFFLRSTFGRGVGGGGGGSWEGAGNGGDRVQGIETLDASRGRFSVVAVTGCRDLGDYKLSVTR